ncbi:lactoylglutathione lyase [Blastocystis sp. ATCC 50177/Nand II]|uniref:Lactoylglutathione lyase n=1 Tax=Blastocystis sp. subtype 1 (strain ATCC 50177 / NandII) TaxID=478820 RepID=A0A196SLU3_BLAHN|nr:lactoylglutathione lyase [Blastocystis sp. ATCC 50177/Nand II]
MFANVAKRAFATGKPYRILGVQQIAIGGTSKAALQNLWCNIFGLENLHSFESPKENVKEDVLRCGKGPMAVEVDIMEPYDPNKSPKVNNPPLNHIGLWVDDLPACVKSLTEQGVRFTPGGIRKGASGYDITFVHPKGKAPSPLSGEGVLIELVQAPKEVIEFYDKL